MKGDFYLGAWLVQPSVGKVSLDGRTVHVRPKVMDLLVYLSGSPGIVISKETLLNEVWRTDAISESALTRTITELRNAVADDPNQPRFLETIPKRGYRLIASVRPVVSPGDNSPRQRGAPALAIWVAALLIVGSIALLVFERTPAKPTGAPRVKPLTSLPGQESQPCFSPDGKQVAFVWSGEVEVGRSNAIQVTNGGGTNPVESPDGTHVYYKKGPAPGLEIYRTPVNGGNEVHVLGPIPRAPAGAWVPDSNGIYFIEPWQIAYYRFATGRKSPIVSLPANSIVAGPGLALSPDGRWLLYGQRDRVGSDIMLIESFR